MDEKLTDGEEEWGQMLLLQQITRTSGVLHEAQVLQLKYLPLMLTNATKSSFEFNYEGKVVTFTLTALEGKAPKNLSSKLKLLTKYTKNLLGNEYAVVVKVAEKIAYQTKGNRPNGSKPSSRRKPGKNRKNK